MANQYRIRQAYYIEKKSQREIALELGCSRNTVKKALEHNAAFEYRRQQPAPAPVLGPYKDRLHELVAAQPVAALLNRFGKMGRILHRLALGRDTSRVTEYASPQVARARRDFAGALSDWPRLDAALDALLDDAAAALLDAGQTVRHLALVLTVDDGAALE